MGIPKLVLLTKLQSVNREKCDVKKTKFVKLWNSAGHSYQGSK